MKWFVVGAIATLLAVASMPAILPVEPMQAGGCPNANGIGSRLASDVATVSFSASGGTVTFSVDTTDRGAVDGEPGIIAYCVYPMDVLPDDFTATYEGAVGPWGEASHDGYFAFVRSDGNPNNIPLDGTTGIEVGEASGLGDLSVLVILLHIQDPDECTELYGSGSSCFVFPQGATPPPEEGELCGIVFYDANANGVQDGSEVGIAGWKVELYDGDGALLFTLFTDEDGNFCFLGLPDGDYTVVEVPPPDCSCVATTDASVDVALPPDPEDVSFGIVCLGAGGGHTIGYWSHGPGKNLITDDDLAALSDLHLVDAEGNDFDPTTVDELREWIQGTAVNMACKLSNQLAAMVLNVAHGLVDGSALVYDGSGFVTVNDLITAADDALEADGYTPSGDPNRDIQEFLKDALDDANNNLNFVLPEPCEFTSPY